MKKVCIGILAHNEAGRIQPLFEDLRRQTLLTNRAFKIIILVIANGCTDTTAEVSKSGLSLIASSHSEIETSVYELAQGGKSNAWNELIHRFVPSDTDFVFLLDADIRIPENETLQMVLDGLASCPRAAVAVDESVKDLAIRKPQTISERLISAATGTANNTRLAIAGALYCARYSELSKIWMPVGLPGEDGFLRAMLLTKNFSSPDDINRLVFVEGARHIFESERTLAGVFRHNVRLAIGTGINVLLFHHLRKKIGEGTRVSQYIQERNESDPKWVNSLIDERMKLGAFFVIERSFLTRRWKFHRTKSVMEQARGLPVLALGILFDVIVFLRANQLMRKGAGAGFW